MPIFLRSVLSEMSASTIKFATALFLTLLTGVIPIVAESNSAPQRCEQQIYAAPDGRLTPHVIGHMPKFTEPVVGFEIIRGKPLVALPRQLVGFTDKNVNELAVPEPVKGLSFNKESRLMLQTATGFLTIGDTGLEPDETMTRTVHGRLYGSGSQVFVEVRAHQGVLQFVARKQNGSPFLIASVKGKLHAASWNDIGLAAVVGDSLYVWQAGAKNIVRLLSDQGLSAARDVVLVGPNRAVVSLKTTVFLITSETVIVVLKMPLARCRFQHSVLYLLDGQTGLIWSLQGLDQLGTKKGDQAYAADLLKQLPRNADERAVKFQEAARILGCDRAREQLANLRNTAQTHKDKM
jgi:hypothetical protein